MTSDPIEVVVGEWVKRVIFECRGFEGGAGLGRAQAGRRPGVGPSPRHLASDPT